MLAPYSRYAEIYDRTGQHRFGAVMAQIALAWLAERLVSPVTALDLATGTGAAALSLARHGIEVTGLDNSEAMLEIARRKRDPAGQGINWLLGDMREFRLDHPVDLVVCFFDAVNYLLNEDDLRACFRGVYDSLTPGGWFVFDINPIHRYATDWNGNRDVAYADNRLVCLFRATFDPDTGRSPLVLTVFERLDDAADLWRRWEETHIERGYPLADIKTLLEAAGLSVVETRSLDEQRMELGADATDEAMRAVFFTQRPSLDGKMSP
jgi:ubiquinone/menaquinone biosynthesis C-methylase UbiE